MDERQAADRRSVCLRETPDFGRSDGYQDERSCLPAGFEIYRWTGRMPERKGELVGQADTLKAAWALIRDRRHEARGIGWFWILDLQEDRAWFDLQENRRGLTIRDERCGFGRSDDPDSVLET